MREIKFRAWDKVSKQMSPSFKLFGEFTMIGGVHAWQESHRSISKENCLEALNDLVVMQYTGIKDINGVEIYEGDVLRVDYDNGDDVSTHKVYWGGFDYPAFELFPNLPCECNGLSHCVNDADTTIEVIGNIHENPELLEGEI